MRKISILYIYVQDNIIPVGCQRRKLIPGFKKDLIKELRMQN